MQQKGRKWSISLQDKVDRKTTREMQERHKVKLENFSEKNFVCPIVNTAKKDGSIKFALDSTKMNKPEHKNKYRMPNIDQLMNNMS